MDTPGVPAVSFPPELPISDRVAELTEAIERHQVVVVAGETGSGKSTQLPKICLAMGRGTNGRIGHTQPRRLAARSVAERVAEELSTDVGDVVGYAVRFTDRVRPHTRIKLMTDGILLAEIQRDRSLSAYDTLIIDEAHERSLNIDFLLGCLKRLLPHRPELRVIVTSATIDTERFSRYFDDAPVVEVSGRTFPVEIRYRPLSGPEVTDDRDQPRGICDAVTELWSEGQGDILVFCSGEREIRDAADALGELSLPDTEIFPLFARLSSAEQHRVFARHRGRRIVLATNVAETSLTVPGIRSVVDPGTARISRYNQRTKVQRLPIEPVSQASADQRAGRCGRVAPGVCIRLYSEDDFDARPQFTEPEIHRTNLGSVILQMAALGLGQVEGFPFVQPPDQRNIRDGILLLEELGAVDPDHQGTRNWLTPVGRRLARLPIDPRLGRMIIEAGARGCLSEVLVIVSGLSIQDPRERPTAKRQAADEHHARFVDERSDFLGLLHLWAYVTDEKRARSSSQFRRMCRREFLNYTRLREWQDLHGQLGRVARQLGLTANEAPASPDQIHRALLAGLLSHIGHLRPKDKKQRGREYAGARGSRFVITAGSGLSRSGSPWVMAGELVETNRLWARMVAPIEPEWVEELAGGLATRSHDEPVWDEQRGSSLVHERVTLYGLPVVVGRPVQYVRVAPRHARDLFIENALVDGRWEAGHGFIAQNRRVRREAAEWEARTRRAESAVDRLSLFRFYDERLGADVANRRAFDRWWKRVSIEQPDLLDLSLADVCGSPPEEALVDQFPLTWHHDGRDVRLLYEYDVTSESDGVTIEIPMADLGSFSPEPFTWNVPGHHVKVLEALIRTLPRDLRKAFVPVPATARALLDEIDCGVGDVRVVLAEALTRRSGVMIEPGQLHLDRLAPFLRLNFLLLDERGEPFLESRDLGALRRAMDEQVRATLSSGRHRLERQGLVTWDLDLLPRSVETEGAGHRVRVYPALADRGDHVDVVLTPSPAEQSESHWAGVRRLLRLAMTSPLRQLDRLLDNDTKLAIAGGGQARSGWYHDAIGCALDAVMERHGGPVWDRPSFERLLSAAGDEFPGDLALVAEQVNRLAPTLSAIGLRLDESVGQATGEARDDIRRHLERLTYDGFLIGVGLGRLPDVARYVAAIEYRLERLDEHPGRDAGRMHRCQRLEAEFWRTTDRLPPSEAVEAVAWMLEEFRVSMFAQPLGVAGRVSEKRIGSAIADLRAERVANGREGLSLPSVMLRP